MIKSQNFYFLNGTLINLHAFEGGMITGEIVKNSPWAEMMVKKHITKVRYEDFVFEAGLSNEIIEWIKKTWRGENLRLTSTFVTTDASLKIEYEDIFLDSQLVETLIPQCDVGSKEHAFLRLRIKPTLIEYQKGDGRVIRPPIKFREKIMLKSNFRFELGRLPCSRVCTIDSFSVVVYLNGRPITNNSNLNMTTNSIDFPNLFLTISSVDLNPWLDWHKQFIVEGNSSQADELSGRLVFLAPNLRDEVLAIRLKGVGIFSLQRKIDRVDISFRFSVGLYCEQMEIES